MQDIDIWRAAKLQLDLYGENADLDACQRADKALDEGDLEGVRVWKRVRAAIAILNLRELPADKRLH